jgi:VanZ family protein
VSLKRLGFVILALAITATILLGTNLPGDNRLAFSLQDSGHFLIFSVLTLVVLRIYQKCRIRTQWLMMLLLLLFGVLAEVLQSYVGRDPSWYDVLMDLLGIAAGGLLYIGFIRRSFSPPLCTIAVLALAVMAFSQPIYWLLAYQVRSDQFPRLLDPDSFFSRALIEGSQGGDLRHIDLPMQWASDADLAVDSCVYVTLLKGRWPGVDMQEPAPDWRGYDSLELSIYSDQSKVLPLMLRINDQSHSTRFDDRYNRRLQVHPGYNHFSLPMSEILQAPMARTMDLGAVSGVMIYTSQQHAGSGFCLLSMGLR